MPPDDIWIDQSILMEAGVEPAERERWTKWATALLEKGYGSGEWPEGKPVLSDRAGTRGPGGERYVLLGFGTRKAYRLSAAAKRRTPEDALPELGSRCVACDWPTDTAILLEGPGEFLSVALQKMGIPESRASSMVGEVCVTKYRCDPGNMPVFDIVAQVKACGGCAAKAGFKMVALALTGSELPLYRIPDDMRMLPDEDLALAAEVRAAWLEAGDRPIVLSKDSVVLGSYSIRTQETALALHGKNGTVHAIRLDRLYPEDSDGKKRLHQIAEIVTGGYAVNS